MFQGRPISRKIQLDKIKICNKTKLQVSKPIYPNNNINLITAEIIPSIPIYNNDIAPLPPLLEIYTTHYIPHVLSINTPIFGWVFLSIPLYSPCIIS